MPNASEMARIDAEALEGRDAALAQSDECYDASHKGEIARHLDEASVDVTRSVDLDLLTDLRMEIRRINEAAGRTVFNPALTSLLQGVLDGDD